MRSLGITKRFIAALALPALVGGVVLGADSASAEPRRENCAMADQSVTYAPMMGHMPANGDVPTGTIPVYDEVWAEMCYGRVGDTAQVAMSWHVKGHLNVGVFRYFLIDCATNKSSDDLSDEFAYERGTKLKGDRKQATWKLKPGHKYRPLVTGTGQYRRVDRGESDVPMAGAIGQFDSSWREKDANRFVGSGRCE